MRLRPGLITLLISTFIVYLAFAETWKIEGISMGMDSKEVVRILGRNYRCDDLGNGSAIGLDCWFVFSEGSANEVWVEFKDNKVRTVIGYTFDGKKCSLKRGDPASAIGCLGIPDDFDKSCKVFEQGGSRLLVFLKNDIIDRIGLEWGPKIR